MVWLYPTYKSSRFSSEKVVIPLPPNFPTDLLPLEAPPLAAAALLLLEECKWPSHNPKLSGSNWQLLWLAKATHSLHSVSASNPNVWPISSTEKDERPDGRREEKEKMIREEGKGKTLMVEEDPHSVVRFDSCSHSHLSSMGDPSFTLMLKSSNSSITSSPFSSAITSAMQCT